MKKLDAENRQFKRENVPVKQYLNKINLKHTDIRISIILYSSKILTSSVKSSSSCVDNTPKLTKKCLSWWLLGGRFSLLRYVRIIPFSDWACCHPKSSKMMSAWFFQPGSYLILWYPWCHTIIFTQLLCTRTIWKHEITRWGYQKAKLK